MVSGRLPRPPPATAMDEFLTRLRRALHLPDGTEPTDAQLLARYVEHREDAAFAALVQRHGQMVFGVCRRALAVPDAEDAFQATFLVLMRRAASVVPREQLAAWLYGVARRTALKARERAQRRFARERTVAELPDVGALAAPRDEALAVIDEELERLPAKYRAPVLLCDVEGLTREEAARQLGWAVGTLSWRLSAARKLLADRLSRRGVGLSAVALASAAGAPPAVAGVPSPEVVSLADEVLSAMTTTKLRLFAGALCVTLATGIGAAVFATPEPPPVAKEVPKAAAPVPPVKEMRGEPKLRATLDHKVSVHAMAYSVDGKRLATAGAFVNRSGDRKHVVPVRIWDTATDKELRTIESLHSEDVAKLQFGSGSQLFVAEPQPAIWDADTGKELVRLKVSKSDPTYGSDLDCVAFAPDGKTLVTGELFGSARLWDAATGEEKAKIPNGAGSLGYTPDGKTLVLAGRPRVIRLWDVVTNKERATIKLEGAGEALLIAVSTDGKRIAYEHYVPGMPEKGEEFRGYRATIRVVDFTGKELARSGARNATCREIAFSPDGAMVMGVSSSVWLWDAHTGEKLAVLADINRDMFAVFSPDGNTIAIGYGTEVQLWDISALRKKK